MLLRIGAVRYETITGRIKIVTGPDRTSMCSYNHTWYKNWEMKARCLSMYQNIQKNLSYDCKIIEIQNVN